MPPSITWDIDPVEACHGGKALANVLDLFFPQYVSIVSIRHFTHFHALNKPGIFSSSEMKSRPGLASPKEDSTGGKVESMKRPSFTTRSSSKRYGLRLKKGEPRGDGWTGWQKVSQPRDQA